MKRLDYLPAPVHQLMIKLSSVPVSTPCHLPIPAHCPVLKVSATTREHDPLQLSTMTVLPNKRGCVRVYHTCTRTVPGHISAGCTCLASPSGDITCPGGRSHVAQITIFTVRHVTVTLQRVETQLSFLLKLQREQALLVLTM